MSPTDNDIHLFLGRVEGKLDAVITTQASFTSTLERWDDRAAKLSERVTILETRRSVLKEWAALTLSVLATLAAVYANMKGLFH